jgi:ankyrin repeat protein
MALFYDAASHFDLGSAALQELIARDEFLGRPDSYGKTLLHHASEQGHGSAVMALVEAGVALEAQDRDGRTPLHLACLMAGHPARARGSDHVMIAKYLQDHQASTGVQVRERDIV